jgi:hypothetical protein
VDLGVEGAADLWSQFAVPDLRLDLLDFLGEALE